MNKDLLRASCVQMCSGEDRVRNLSLAEEMLGVAASDGVRLAVLPENFSYMGRDDAAKRAAAEYIEDSIVLDFLSEQAKRHRMVIIGGSVLLKQRDSDHFRNACPVFSSNGNMLAIYDKIHLFDVDLGQERYSESELTTAGTEPRSINLGPWQVGLSICYDLRFPELYRYYSNLGCQILSIPSAFTVPTGKAHWETLLRARSIENQSYVLASGQSGEHPGGRVTWGHSMIVDPWGEVLACQDEGDGLVVATLDMARVHHVRAMVPALNHRRMWAAVQE